MLVIRKEQMDAFEKNMLDTFNNKMVLRLRHTYPEETSSIPDDDLSAMVSSGAEKAESYGIDEDYDIQRFLGCMLTYGTDFDTDSAHPEVQVILADARLDGEEKIDLIQLYYNNF